MKNEKQSLKEILDSWNRFIISESIKEKFEDKDIGKNVIIKSCCSECKEYFDKQKLKHEDTGTLLQINLADREITPNGRKENFVLVKSKKEEKQYPQCCITTG